VFVKRSFISPHIFSRISHESPFSDLLCLKDFKVPNVECDHSIVLCKSDPQMIRQRIASRISLAVSDEEIQLRSMIGENNDNHLQKILQLYADLEQTTKGEGCLECDSQANQNSLLSIDAVLNTTSIKQASAAILRLFGLEFRIDFTRRV